ncbi:protein kinase [Accumulibacter sp.]|uniref:protein kinase domain-containing protein n=1 Tax=Accumulibacter sp. TaxID=2053492 RepID=UPI002B6C1203|nr:protein kinase [Accumulibacter sp.]HMW62846.1 protein kinase [Accumulibacter sp.]HNB66816.1 protein kinase [Accumulibacter sp.]HND37701.1 protein kinase [Accumulibacter sp.]HNG85990.1 protein kinase [Accumulibacter sp.]HNI50047.1 protein kinase [Accumulibacter sp.]
MPASEEDQDKTWVLPAKAAPASPAAAAAIAVDKESNALSVGTMIGEFEITGLIGIGGFGIVYLAHDQSLGRNIALKEYMPASLAARIDGLTVSVQSDRLAETFAIGLRSFVNEARILAQFDHPALVKVYRFWEANGTAYMVMPFYEGITLKQALQKMPQAPSEDWLRAIINPLLDALEVIHRDNCFHRDIAPDNILLLADGRPLLLDFGAARRVISDRTQALTVILKPGYAPLEQYAEVPQVKQGAWTDIYAMAAVVYNAITGRPPMPSVARSMNDTMPPLSKVAAGRYSAGFLAAIDRALAVKPGDRPQTIAEWRTLLAQKDAATPPAQPALAERGTAGEAAREAAPLPGKKRTGLLAGLAGAALLASAGAYYALRPQPATPVAPTPQSAATTPTPAALPTAAQPPAGAAGTSSTRADEPTTPSGQTKVATAGGQGVTEKELVDLLLGKNGAAGRGGKTFDPVDMLEEIHRQRDVEHLVTVLPEKAKVRIGQDKLRFRVTSLKPGYLYILMVGTDRSHFNLLFPNAIDADNAIAGDGELNLPRSGWAMTAAGPAGTNRFVAFVSENRRDFTAAGLKKIDPFAEFPLKQAAKIAAEAPAGAGNPFAGKVICPSGQQKCSSRYGAAVFSIEEID